MKPTFKIVYPMLLAIGLSACCTKKHCENQVKTLVVVPKGFDIGDRLKVHTIDKKSQAVTHLDVSTDFPTHFKDSDAQPLKNFDYVIETSFGGSDTLKNMKYEAKSSNKVCNRCVFGGSDTYEVYTYSDFSYEYQGRVLSSDTVYIVKP